MNKTLVFWPVAILIACTSAPYALRDMGSFHVGGAMWRSRASR